MNDPNPYTSPELEASIKPTSPIARLANPWIVLALLAGTHFLVDIVAGTTTPIWPSLEHNLSLKTGGLLWVYVCWSIATSFGQLFFGIWADRRPCRWLIWAGPLLAILCLSCVGLADSSLSLAALFFVGGLGIAAFHPEAAATAGALAPEQRSRAMAIFALCGYLGQSAGPLYSGMITDHLQLRGLVWGIAWGLPILFLLWIGLRRVPAPATSEQQAAPGETTAKVPVRTLVLLLAVGASRIVPALGVPLALAYLLKATSSSNAVIGAVQSAFMAGIGIGAMFCAAFLKPKWERRALWVFPLLAAPLLAIMIVASGWTLVVLVGTCGLLLGVTMPVYISYGQQLLPHGQRVASSITMGVSWGIASGLVAVAMWIFNSFDALSSIFGFFAAASLASSLLSRLLPVAVDTGDRNH
ncbi:MAG: MFS transporter [Planctomycetes bacterium]|nr:MFS transporter [Planctomycetota bacterium]